MSDCLFCKIIAGDIPSDKIYEDEHVYAFSDISPVAPLHALIIPKKHISMINDVEDTDAETMGSFIYSSEKNHQRIRCVRRGLSNCYELWRSGRSNCVSYTHAFAGRS